MSPINTSPVITQVGLQSVGRALVSARGFYPLVLGVTVGSSFWVTFIAGPIQYYNLPRMMFGNLQSVQFPAFFALQTVTSSMLLLAYLACTPLRKAFVAAPGNLRNPAVFNSWLLITMVTTGLANLGYAGPRATSIMQDRHRLQKLEGTTYDAEIKSPRMESLNKRFAVAHSVSSLLNVAYFGAAVIHTAWLGRFGSMH